MRHADLSKTTLLSSRCAELPGFLPNAGNPDSGLRHWRDSYRGALVYHQSLCGWLDTIQGDPRARILRHRCRVSILADERAAKQLGSRAPHYQGANSYETNMARPFRLSHRGGRGRDFDRSV